MCKIYHTIIHKKYHRPAQVAQVNVLGEPYVSGTSNVSFCPLHSDVEDDDFHISPDSREDSETELYELSPFLNIVHQESLLHLLTEFQVVLSKIPSCTSMRNTSKYVLQIV